LLFETGSWAGRDESGRTSLRRPPEPPGTPVQDKGKHHPSSGKNAQQNSRTQRKSNRQMNVQRSALFIQIMHAYLNSLKIAMKVVYNQIKEDPYKNKNQATACVQV